MTDAAIEAAVELGRQAPDCERHGGAWCSCKVRWFVAALVDGGHMVSAEQHRSVAALYDDVEAERTELRDSIHDYERERDDARAALTALFSMVLHLDLDALADLIYEAGANHPDCTCDQSDFDCWYRWSEKEKVKYAFRDGARAVWKRLLNDPAFTSARAFLAGQEQP